MSANPKRSTGKSKRRWKALQARGEWIPDVAILACDLKGNWDGDVVTMRARDLDAPPQPTYDWVEIAVHLGPGGGVKTVWGD